MKHLADFVEYREAFAADDVKNWLGDRARFLLVEVPLAKGWGLYFERRPDILLRLVESSGNRACEGTLPIRCDHVSHERVERTGMITRLIQCEGRSHCLLPELVAARNEPDQRRLEKRQQVHDLRRIERQCKAIPPP